MRITPTYVLLVSLAALVPTSVLAQSFSTTPVGGVTIDGGIGIMSGASREYVYDIPGTGRVVSKLRWELSDVRVFNAGIAYRPLDWMLFGIKATTNISSGGLLDDYDYDVDGCPPSSGGTLCHSHHPDTRTQSVLMLDASVAGRFATVAGLNVAAVAGYKRDTYKWQAFNGTSNYADDFNAGLGATYQQWWETPYLGLAFDGQWGKIGMTGRVVGSAWASGHDRDTHHARSLLFEEKFGSSGYIGTDFGLSYQVTDAVRLGIDYHYQRFMTAKGPTFTDDLQTGERDVVPGPSAGGSAELHVLTAGLKINLQPVERRDAADATREEKSPAAPARWRGFYAGAAFGWLGQQSDWTTVGNAAIVAGTANADLGSDGVLAGFFGGYNWQRDRLVFGFEGDVSFTNNNRTKIGLPGTASTQWLAGSADSVVHETGLDGSFRLRAGLLATPNLLLYGTAGIAMEDVTARVSCTAFATWCIADRNETVSKTLTGWTVGAGFEQMFAGNVFLRGEYRYTDLGSFRPEAFKDTAVDAIAAKVDESSHRVIVGLGMKF